MFILFNKTLHFYNEFVAMGISQFYNDMGIWGNDYEAY